MVAAVTVRKSGFAEMAYVGETPWHGLGQELHRGADIETWKREAGMEWRVQRGIVRYATAADGQGLQELPESHVLFRSDTKQSLGIVSAKYQVVQPGEILEFFRELTEAHGYHLNTAGTLFDGKRFWALAEIGDETQVVRGDKVGGYLLLSSSCDGTLATTARFTTVRVVCNNTLTMATRGSKAEVTVRHTSKFQPESVKQQLGLAHQHFEDTTKLFADLATVQLTDLEAEDLVATVLVDNRMSLGADAKKSAPFKGIMQLYHGGAKGADLAGDTAWGLVNAVTEYVDHHAKAKTDSHRLSSAWFGRGDTLKTKVFEEAQKLVA